MELLDLKPELMGKKKMERLNEEGNLPKVWRVEETYSFYVVATDNEMDNWEREEDLARHTHLNPEHVEVETYFHRRAETDEHGNGYVGKLLQEYPRLAEYVIAE